MSTSATYAVNLPLTNYIIGWYGTQTHDPHASWLRASRPPAC